MAHGEQVGRERLCYTGSMKIAAVCGSLQRRSGNRLLLEDAASRAPIDFKWSQLEILSILPHFNPDLEKDALPTLVTAWRSALAECDALLIATPEYGHSLPGALKNGIDWVVQSGELYQKKVIVTASVTSAERGRQGISALCDTLLAVDAQILWREPIARGAGYEERVDAMLTVLHDALLVARHDAL